ncbi:metal-dependent hydrolase [Mariniblastus fucicola]|uniref:Inner membrane protein n=1 Tax=Mariniblastus fucicola TaxID=980251 RepID=A0A5B9PDR4_9BACT|nr:metal-dependent hydrolase [Mariniblastus fucicola]QEG24424.1 hypothetical protein MFFC18_43430 [Mariniblastus fucicola]
MADFKTHITASTILGIGYGGVAHLKFDVPLGHCMIAGALCSVAGMLPDLDSKSGIPQREMLCFVSVLVPMLMMFRFQELGFTAEQMVFVAGVSYVVIRFGLGELFKRFTKHRGMWHSIPAAAVAAMATYLVCFSPETGIRLFKAWSVFLGFILHLLLDELYSVDMMGRRLKKSWGTALKFFGKDSFANISTYTKVGLLALLIANDGTLMDCCRDNGFYNHGVGDDHDHEHKITDHLPSIEPDYLQGLFERTDDSVRR